MKKDRIYQNKLKTLAPFDFNSQVAEVFEDMIDRSVPGYSSLQHLCTQLAEYYAKANSKIYDLGCSSSTTLINIAQLENLEDVELIGIDNSSYMIEKSKKNISNFKLKSKIHLKHEDIVNCDLSNASLIFLNYTLQFLDPELRVNLLKNVYSALNKGGILLVSEKIQCKNNNIQSFIRYLHEDFKEKNGYSKLEIAQKRNALEDVLIPLSFSENIALLKDAGFKLCNIEPFLIHSPFASIIATK